MSEIDKNVSLNITTTNTSDKITSDVVIQNLSDVEIIQALSKAETEKKYGEALEKLEKYQASENLKYKKKEKASKEIHIEVKRSVHKIKASALIRAIENKNGKAIGFLLKNGPEEGLLKNGPEEGLSIKAELAFLRNYEKINDEALQKSIKECYEDLKNNKNLDENQKLAKTQLALFLNPPQKELLSEKDITTQPPKQKSDASFISKLILRAQNKSEEIDIKGSIAINQNPKLRFEKIQVLSKKEENEKNKNSDSDAVMDTLEIRQVDPTVFPAKEIDPKNRKYIINFLGNDARFEDEVDSMIAEATRLECNVIGFNYRGVGKSRGTFRSAQDLVQDGIAQVKRLLIAGVPPENITLKGQSLGGAIATLVAAHFHEKQQKVYLFNGRSFSKLSETLPGLVALIVPRVPEHAPFSRLKNWLLDYIIRPIIGLAALARTFLKNTAFEMNAVGAWKNISEDHKEYLVVKGTEEDIKKIKEKDKGEYGFRKHFGSDEIISSNASLHEAVKEDNKVNKDQKLKNYNQFHYPSSSSGGHNVPLSELVNTNITKEENGENPITGQEFFDHFFNNQKKSENEKTKLYSRKEEKVTIETLTSSDLSSRLESSQQNLTENKTNKDNTKDQNNTVSHLFTQDASTSTPDTSTSIKASQPTYTSTEASQPTSKKNSDSTPVKP